MSTSKSSRLLDCRLPDRLERVAMIIGTVASWIMFALLFRFADKRMMIFTSILSGPDVLLLTYFAFGGDIPVGLRRKGFGRPAAIAVIFWISLVAAVVVEKRFLHGTEPGL